MNYAHTQTTSQHSLWDKFWRDDQGNVVIWQMPNIWLIGWAVLTFISLFFRGNSTPANWLSFAGDLFLAVWAVLEVARGVNYFRRLLGFVVLLFVIASIVKSL